MALRDRNTPVVGKKPYFGSDPTVGAADVFGEIFGSHSGFTYSEFLNFIVNSGMSAADLLAFLGSSLNGVKSSDMSKDQYNDFLKQLIDTQLNRMLTNEQNQYNSPAAQVQRLMQAGMSRDAALGALSPSTQAQPTPLGVSPAPSETALNESQRTANTFANVASAASIACGLVSCGVGAATSIIQAKIASKTFHLNDVQVQAYDLVGEACGIADEAGYPISSENFGNGVKIYDTITKLAANGNAAAKSFLDSGKAQQLSSNYFVSNAAAELHKSRRMAADYDDMFDANLNLLEAQANFENANATRVMQEYENLKETLGNIAASTEYLKTMKTVGEEQAKHIQEQIKETKAQAQLLREQGKTEAAKRADLRASVLQRKADAWAKRQYGQGIKLDNVLKENLVGGETDGQSNIEIINGAAMYKTLMDFKRFKRLSSPDQVEAYCRRILADNESAEQIALMKMWLASGSTEQFNQYPELFKVAYAMQQSGMFDILDNVNTSVQSNTGVNAFIFKHNEDATTTRNPIIDGFLQSDDGPIMPGSTISDYFNRRKAVNDKKNKKK